jgi:hypothetical protein
VARVSSLEASLTSLQATMELKIELAVAKTKMTCGGLMLQHVTTGPGPQADAGARTPGAGSSAAPTPQPISTAFTSFFTDTHLAK